MKPGPKVVRFFLYSTQLNMFVLLINLKLLTIADSFLLNMAEHENFSANKYENANCCWHFYIYTERKKKRRVNFIPKFHSSLKKFVKYFTMITKRYMYGTKISKFHWFVINKSRVVEVHW